MRDELVRQLMKGVPARASVEELRWEFAAHGLEGWLWSWLARGLLAAVYAQLKPRYAASIYSPSGEWDQEGAWELVQDFLIERGIERGAIAAALGAADTVSGVQRYLEVALHRYAISERRRDIASNVFGRLADALDADPALRPLRGLGMKAAYGLEEWRNDPPEVMEGAKITDAVRLIPQDVKWAEYKSGTRLSPGIHSRDLARIAQALIRGTNALWTAGQIMTVIEARFSLDQDDPERAIGGDEVLAHVPAPEPVLERVVAEELAQAAMSRLSVQQLSILRLMTEEPGIGTRAIADRLGVSKSLVNNEQHRIAAAFSELPLLVAEEKEQVINTLSALLQADLPPSPASRRA